MSERLQRGESRATAEKNDTKDDCKMLKMFRPLGRCLNSLLASQRSRLSRIIRVFTRARARQNRRAHDGVKRDFSTATRARALVRMLNVAHHKQNSGHTLRLTIIVSLSALTERQRLSNQNQRSVIPERQIPTSFHNLYEASFLSEADD